MNGGLLPLLGHHRQRHSATTTSRMVLIMVQRFAPNQELLPFSPGPQPLAGSARDARPAAPVPRRRPASRPDRPRGFTLVEMLVTTAVTLTILLALVNVFAWVGDRVASGRAMIEMSNALRAASTRLRTDLDNLTVPVRPFPSPDSSQGYFEYIERVLNDDSGRKLPTPLSLVGDTDDILAFTARSVGERYTGQWLGPQGGNLIARAITAPEAEVYWWAQYDDINGDLMTTADEQVSRSLHRRVLLIRPDLNRPATGNMFTLPTYFNPGKNTYNTSNNADLILLLNDLRRLYNTTNISFRLTSTGNANNLVVNVTANTLADLSQRENRWLRRPYVIINPANGLPGGISPNPNFPFPVDENGTATSLSLVSNFGDRLGEDVILSNVLAFDVRAFDPTARIIAPNGIALLPPDPGWTPALAANNANVVGRGGFVDLNYRLAYGTTWNTAANSLFSGPMNAKARMSALGYSAYDTWSFFYEHDGVDQDGTGGADQGTNGIDDNLVNGPDDPLERETSPPYPVPLRGIQVILRVLDGDTRQVRQATIVANFIPD
ncbi:MAG: type II secretion system protein J [Planctomycetota bacterium]